jgi:hypothetical protein
MDDGGSAHTGNLVFGVAVLQHAKAQSDVKPRCNLNVAAETNCFAVRTKGVFAAPHDTECAHSCWPIPITEKVIDETMFMNF